MGQQEQRQAATSALGDIVELCEMGLNSENPAHWEAALQEVLGQARAALATLSREGR